MKGRWDHFKELEALYWLRPQLTYAEFVYCVALLNHADQQGKKYPVGSTFVGPEMIAKETGFTLRHVKGAAARMKRLGIVSVVEPGRRGHQGVVMLTASGIGEAHCTESSPDSVKPIAPNNGDSVKRSAGFGEVQTSDSVKPTSPSSAFLSAKRSATRRCAPRTQPVGDHALIMKTFCDAWQLAYGRVFPDSSAGAVHLALGDSPSGKKGAR